MSVQSLNGDSYQGAQVGANVQSQVGTSHVPPGERTRAQEPSVVSALPASVQREGSVATNLTNDQTKPKKDNHCRGESRPHLVNAFGSGLSVTLGRRDRSKRRRARGPRLTRRVDTACSVFSGGRRDCSGRCFQVSLWFWVFHSASARHGGEPRRQVP